MNTPKQLLTRNPGDFAVHRSLISRAWQETPGHNPAAVARRKHWRLAVLIFGGIALVAYPLCRALAGLPLQEFEGLGAFGCAAAYIGIFLWRMSRALTQDSLQAERPDAAPDTSREKPPVTESELRRK